LGVLPRRADRELENGAILLEQVIHAAVVRRRLGRDRLGAGRTDRALDPHHFFAFFTGGFSLPAGSPPGSTTLPSLAESFRRSTSPAGISVPGDASRNAAAGSPSSTTRTLSAVSQSLRSATIISARLLGLGVHDDEEIPRRVRAAVVVDHAVIDDLELVRQVFARLEIRRDLEHSEERIARGDVAVDPVLSGRRAGRDGTPDGHGEPADDPSHRRQLARPVTVQN